MVDKLLVIVSNLIRIQIKRNSKEPMFENVPRYKNETGYLNKNVWIWSLLAKTDTGWLQSTGIGTTGVRNQFEVFISTLLNLLQGPCTKKHGRAYVITKDFYVFVISALWNRPERSLKDSIVCYPHPAKTQSRIPVHRSWFWRCAPVGTSGWNRMKHSFGFVY